MDNMLKKYGFEENHLVLIAGDFNINAKNAIHPIEFVKDLNIEQLKYKDVYNEYEFILSILAGNKVDKDNKDKIIDLLKVNIEKLFDF